MTVLSAVVVPGRAGSQRLDELSEPAIEEGEILVEGIAWGICGTDREIVDGRYGWPVPGTDRLVLGHEAVGVVLEGDDELHAGDLVVGIVRRPDPVPCGACAVGQWDMCRNGRYTEHGIKELDGFGRQRWRAEPSALVRIDPSLGHLGVLVEPASVVAKAWQHIEMIGERAAWEPRRVLVTGAGPIGLLAALLAVQRGFEVHVLDLVTDGPKPSLVQGLGGHYHAGAIADLPEVDIVIECTGVPQVVFDVARATGAGGIVCLTGVSSSGRELTVDLGAPNRSIVLENDVVFGSVNANRSHYEAAAGALVSADPHWLDGLITRHEPLRAFHRALQPSDHDVKVVVDLQR